MKKVIPLSFPPLNRSDNTHSTNRPSYGLALCGLYVVFATIVVLTTYALSSIANAPIFIGLNTQLFNHNIFNVPVTILLQGNGSFHTSNASSCDTIVSLGDLLSSAALMNHVKMIIYLKRQKPGQSNSHFQHINNLYGWNKATAQFYVDDHDMAMTCMVRRANYSMTSQGETFSVIDSVAFCSESTYDPKWICENVVDDGANTYAIQISKGEVTYIGVTKRKEVYMNAGAIANFTGGKYGPVFLQTVNAINEYQQEILQANAVFDVVPFGDCSNYNYQTKLGWLLQLQGSTTMTWQCDSLMDTNSLVLWCMTLYQAALQIFFLPQSAICIIPVQSSKNIVGLAILFVVFWGNENIQTLSTYIYQNPSFGLTFYGLCGPTQLASIVGIMTGNIIQMWFNPRIVIQTWIILLFSVVNWILVFYIEYFIFPKQNVNIVSKCALATSSNCFTFGSIKVNWYVSAIAFGSVTALAILTVYSHSRFVPAKVILPPTNSVLQYLKISDISVVATSPNGCIYTEKEGDVNVDKGILLIKNMLHISSSAMTRTTNALYWLIYHSLPSERIKKYYSNTIGTILIIHLDAGKITRSFSYQSIRDISTTSQ
ncbi:hypothetical protein THRCLA_09971, partial [Thraustotheca clavata]